MNKKGSWQLEKKNETRQSCCNDSKFVVCKLDSHAIHPFGIKVLLKIVYQYFTKNPQKTVNPIQGKRKITCDARFQRK